MANKFNDGSGYWFTLRTVPDGRFVVEIRGDDNSVIAESDVTYATEAEAEAAAERTIEIYRLA